MNTDSTKPTLRIVARRERASISVSLGGLCRFEPLTDVSDLPWLVHPTVPDLDLLFIGPPGAQATSESFGWPELTPVTDLAGATEAIDRIVEQGEGARGDWTAAHYGRFLGVLDDYLRFREERGAPTAGAPPTGGGRGRPVHPWGWCRSSRTDPSDTPPCT